MTSRCRTYFTIASVILSGTAGSLSADEAATDPSPPRREPHAESSAAGSKHAVPGAELSADHVLVRVNGEPITEGDLQFLMISRKVPEDLRASVRKRFLEQIIDRRLMRAYLAERKAEPNPYELDEQVERILKLIRKQGVNPEEILSQLGYTKETLRSELALPLAWKTHFRRIVTNKRLREYFRKHRRQFDGTERRARQILIKVAAPDDAAEINVAKAKLRRIREEVLDGRLSFAEAAKQHSQAPSAKRGGDLGYFPYRGPMPEAMTRPVFELEVGEISQPIVTPFGVHLVQVLDEKPGRLSLEDVRPQVLEQLSEKLWKQTVRQLRTKATIDWNTLPSPSDQK